MHATRPPRYNRRKGKKYRDEHALPTTLFRNLDVQIVVGQLALVNSHQTLEQQVPSDAAQCTECHFLVPWYRKYQKRRPMQHAHTQDPDIYLFLVCLYVNGFRVLQSCQQQFLNVQSRYVR